MIVEAPRIIDPNGLRHREGVSRMVLETPPPPLRVIPGGTARHEAKHVVAANETGVGVESASIIPGDGYNGITRLSPFSRPSAVVALAPHVTGEDGTGFDVFIARQIGDSGAGSVARRIINANQDKVEAVAEALERKKTIGPSDIDEAIRSVGKPLFESATLVLETKDGRTIKEEVDVKPDNTVTVPVDMLPNQWVVFPGQSARQQ